MAAAPAWRTCSHSGTSRRGVRPSDWSWHAEGTINLIILLLIVLATCCPPFAQSGASTDPLEISNQRESDDEEGLLVRVRAGISSSGGGGESIKDHSLQLSTATIPTSSIISSGNNNSENLIRSFQNWTGNSLVDGMTSSTTTTNSSSVEEARTNILLNVMLPASVVIFICGFSGNFIVILVIKRFTKTQTVTNTYILHLAVADITYESGLVFLATTLKLNTWIFGNAMCKVYMGLTALNQSASSLLLVLMSFDRFIAVCHPIYAQRFRQIKNATAICYGVWFLCIILMMPILIFAKNGNDNGCAIYWPDGSDFNYERAYTLYSFIIGFAGPVTLIAIFYFCVIRKLRKAACGTNLGNSARRAQNRENANKRIERLVKVIIFTYIICWAPYWATQLFVAFSSGSDPLGDYWWLGMICSILSYANSAVNPILYAFMSDNFKQHFMDIVKSSRLFKLCRCTARACVSESKNSNSNSNNNNTNITKCNQRNTTIESETKLNSHSSRALIRRDSQLPTEATAATTANEQTVRLISGQNIDGGAATDEQANV